MSVWEIGYGELEYGRFRFRGWCIYVISYDSSSFEY